MMRLLSILACLSVLSFSLPAHAQRTTTIYTDSSNFGAWANAVNPNNTVGPSDGLTGFIPNGGWIAYEVSPTYTVADFTLLVTGLTGNSTANFYVGRSDGNGWFSALNSRVVTLNTGWNTLSSAAQSSYCVVQGGCDVFIVQAWNNSTLTLDLAAASPEPSVWALMIIAFIGLGFRMKAVRNARGRQKYSHSTVRRATA